jgi:2-polyprenyl-3-methyl-5-hydroxy-6-metoxy-1,4-benzoquinol methylase
MLPLARVDRPERLDAPAHDPAVLAASLAHVAAVNRWLGARRALRLVLAGRLPAAARILDVGTGSADLPRTLATPALRLVATDRHRQMLEVAAAAGTRKAGIALAAADALALPFADRCFDAALLSMVLHHLPDELAVQALREAGRVARLVVINELHRTVSNYLGARLLSVTLWAGNPLTRHDGPLSVLRAYRAAELQALAAAAGLRVIEVRRRWFNRLVLAASPGDQ